MQRCVCLLLLFVAGCVGGTQRIGSSVSERPPVVAPAAPSPQQDSRVVTRLISFEEDSEPYDSNAMFFGPTPAETLVAYAMAHHPEIAIARAKAQAAAARIAQVTSLDDPTLSVASFLEEIQTAAGPQDLMMSLMQKYPWFGKLEAKGQMACHDAKRAFAELADLELAVIEEVKLAHLDLHLLQKSQATTKELIQELDSILELARSRLETAAGKLESIYQAEIERDKLAIALEELKATETKASARLAKALHLPRGATIDIEPTISRASLTYDVDALVAMFVGSHPQLQAKRHAIERDRWAVELAEREYYPNLNLGLSWYSIGDGGISPVSNGNDAFSLTTAINLPIRRVQRNAALREARWKASQSRHSYDANEDALAELVARLHSSGTQSQRILEILDGTIQRANDRFELLTEEFEVGQVTYEMLITAYQDLLRFRLDQIKHRVALEAAIVQLERVVGSSVAHVETLQEASTVAPPVPL